MENISFNTKIMLELFRIKKKYKLFLNGRNNFKGYTDF